MKIKKFIVADMQEALHQIRQELGPDAVIINTVREPWRSFKQLFTGRKIIVTAAMDEAPVAVPTPVPTINETTKLEQPEQPAPPVTTGITRTRVVDSYQTGAAATAYNSTDHCAMRQTVIPSHVQPQQLPTPILPVASEADKSWFSLMLKEQVENQAEKPVENQIENQVVAETQQIAEQRADSKINPDLKDVKYNQTGIIVSSWQRLLTRIEINDTISQKLLQASMANLNSLDVTDDIFLVHLKASIVDLIKPAYQKIKNAKTQTFIGPTGVGKTLTLIKLATRLKMMEQKQIALIAVFNHRFGAMEKLPYYGDLIGVPVEVVMTPAELAQAVQAHQDKDAIFIDTDGRPSRNKSQVLELNSFIGAVGEPTCIRLVLATPTKNFDLIRIAQDFKPVGYHEIIMTKTDETDTYGSLLNLVCDTGVPVSYITSGQNVPDDIEKLTMKSFADIVLRGIVLDDNY